MQASYTLGKSEDLGSQAVGSADFDNSFQPRYAFDPMDNKGLSDFDIRHNFTFQRDVGDSVRTSLTGVRARARASGWQLSSIRHGCDRAFRSARCSGFDRARAAALRRRGTAARSRRRLLAQSGARRRRSVLRSRTASRCRRLGTFGNVPRNTITGPGYGDAGHGVLQERPARPAGAGFSCARKAFNVTNHVELRPAGDDGVQLGRPRARTPARSPTIVGTARQFQFGVKVDF